MSGKRYCKCTILCATHSHDGVIRGEHGSIKHDDFLVLVIRQNIVEPDLLYNRGVGRDPLNVLGTIGTRMEPEG